MAKRRALKTAGRNPSTTEAARELVRRELLDRGAAKVEEDLEGRSVRLRVWSVSGDHQVRVRVRARTTGDWHASLAERDPGHGGAGVEMFWIFVDMTAGKQPRFFIVPEWWMRRDIHHHHEGYLIRHSGVRPEVPESDHHAIEPYRVRKWEGAWQLMGLRAD